MTVKTLLSPIYEVLLAEGIGLSNLLKEISYNWLPLNFNFVITAKTQLKAAQIMDYSIITVIIISSIKTVPLNFPDSAKKECLACFRFKTAPSCYFDYCYYSKNRCFDLVKVIVIMFNYWWYHQTLVKFINFERINLHSIITKYLDCQKGLHLKANYRWKKSGWQFHLLQRYFTNYSCQIVLLVRAN